MADKTPDLDLDTMLGSAVFGFVQASIAAGLTPARAASLAGFAIIEGTLGREATRALGIPRQTLAKWRREVAAAAAAAQELDEQAVQLEAINMLLPAIGLRDLRMTRAEEA